MYICDKIRQCIPSPNNDCKMIHYGVDLDELQCKQNSTSVN